MNFLPVIHRTQSCGCRGDAVTRRWTPRPSRSHRVRTVAPSATNTATARLRDRVRSPIGKQEISVTTTFLDHLATTETALNDTTQQHIDEWLAPGPTTRFHARYFVIWARTSVSQAHSTSLDGNHTEPTMDEAWRQKTDSALRRRQQGRTRHPSRGPPASGLRTAALAHCRTRL